MSPVWDRKMVVMTLFPADEDERREVNSMEIVLTILEVIASIALIVVVLLQSGKEAGLSAAMTGNNDSYLSKSKASTTEQLIAKSTKWIAAAWLVLTLLLSLVG